MVWGGYILIWHRFEVLVSIVPDVEFPMTRTSLVNGLIEIWWVDIFGHNGESTKWCNRACCGGWWRLRGSSWMQCFPNSYRHSILLQCSSISVYIPWPICLHLEANSTENKKLIEVTMTYDRVCKQADIWLLMDDFCLRLICLDLLLIWLMTSEDSWSNNAPAAEVTYANRDVTWEADLRQVVSTEQAVRRCNGVVRGVDYTGFGGPLSWVPTRDTLQPWTLEAGFCERCKTVSLQTALARCFLQARLAG